MALDWENMGAGLLSTGVGLFSANAAKKQEAERMRQAQGPLFNPMNQAAGTALTQAGMNPDQAAAQRFQAGEDVLQPMQAKQQQDLIRMLQAKGMLGVSNFQGAGVDPVTGQQQTWQPTPGQAMNPHMAAFFAAQAGDKAKRLAASQEQGQQWQQNAATRAANLGGAATGQRQGGLNAAATARQAPATGLAGILGQAGPLMQGSGLFGAAGGWLKKLLGGDSYGGGAVASPWGDNSWGID